MYKSFCDVCCQHELSKICYVYQSIYIEELSVLTRSLLLLVKMKPIFCDTIKKVIDLINEGLLNINKIIVKCCFRIYYATVKNEILQRCVMFFGRKI